MTLQQLRQNTRLPVPKILEKLLSVGFEKQDSKPTLESLSHLFPKTSNQPAVVALRKEKQPSKALRIGAVFSGGPAPGGHNVLSGLYDALKTLHASSQLFGFLDGPGGVIKASYQEITGAMLDPYRNQGGFDLLGSGRTKIETEEQLQASLKTVGDLALDGLVIIGGDDSNTNAAILAEYFLDRGSSTKVIGVPKTIDGDLKGRGIEVSFGFDTACKSYSEMIGNIAKDARSAKKYVHFIKLMGRSASHVALECALATHPNMTFIGEEVAAKKQTLAQIGQMLASMLQRRAEAGKSYGVVLIPEGLIEFIPEVAALMKELNTAGPENLSPAAAQCFSSMPKKIQQQLLLDRDPHGNVKVSAIETEKLLIELASQAYAGSFNPVSHFFGYEGRAGFPSNFDCHYCYALGLTAALLIQEGLTGYMSCVHHLDRPVEEWGIGGIPLTQLMHLELRKGEMKPVVQKALVDLQGRPFQQFAKERESWVVDDRYLSPGPIQFFGDRSLTDTIPFTLQLEKEDI